MTTVTDITTHPLKRWQDVDALIHYAQTAGCGTLVTDRIWDELVMLRERVEELGGYSD